MPRAAPKPVQEWFFATPQCHADACQAAAVMARAGRRDNVELGTHLTSLGAVVEVAAVLLPPVPLSALDLMFSW